MLYTEEAILSQERHELAITDKNYRLKPMYARLKKQIDDDGFQVDDGEPLKCMGGVSYCKLYDEVDFAGE